MPGSGIGREDQRRISDWASHSLLRSSKVFESWDVCTVASGSPVVERMVLEQDSFTYDTDGSFPNEDRSTGLCFGYYSHCLCDQSRRKGRRLLFLIFLMSYRLAYPILKRRNCEYGWCQYGKRLVAMAMAEP